MDSRRLGALAALRHDHLMRNALFILLSNATMGAFGFGFWLIGARLFSTSDVGLATTLVTATILISYASLLGFNSTFVRLLPTSVHRDDEISTGLLLTFVSATGLSVLYVVVVPQFVPQLGFVRSSPAYVIGFIATTAFSCVNLLTDAIFIAYRSAHFNMIVDGVVQSGLRMALPVLFVGLGAFGIYAASGIAAFAAVALSVLLLVTRFGYRPRLVVSLDVLRRVLRYSAANYTSNLLAMVPILLLPLLVVHRLGAAPGGYFYIAYQIANLLFAVGMAIGQSLFAEGSQRDASFASLVRRSGIAQLVVVVPGAAVLMASAPWILGIFGAGYRSHATATLVVFAASAPAVALNFWTTSLLRIRDRLAPLIWSNVVYAAVVCGLAAVWVDGGLVWTAVAWLIGNLVSGLYGVAALLRRPAVRPAVLPIVDVDVEVELEGSTS